jgi:hypothetical protein
MESSKTVQEFVNIDKDLQTVCTGHFRCEYKYSNLFISDSHETWKCVDAELQRQIRCFPYVELSDVPWLQHVGEKKPSDGKGILD